jgi:cytochrome c
VRVSVARVLALGVVATLTGLGCGSGTDRSSALATRGDPAVGRDVASERGCAACHRIPGVRGAAAFVGPPLDAWSRRSFIAGTLPNSAANLERWLADPQAVRPGSAMPDLELTESEIDDLVALLFSLD